ncbi:MAG: hypothetical protein A2048_09235 [Deltaproteobacteria bacterium GWA2_45_12]|nr:MAG: hypothetical protein A2048_09235 [Deltaproteobacteria bacterium GWA2_45_12]
MVLAAITVLTTVLVQFAYHSHVNYRLVVNNKERLQAYYLAKSAVNFSKLLLRFNKEAQGKLEEVHSKLGDDQGALGNLQFEPLYKMFPLSSELLRGVLGGDASTLESLTGGGAEENEAPKEEEKDDAEISSDDVGIMEKEEIEKFLDFEGDFDTEISEEQNKYDLNKINTTESTSPAYDLRKKLLYSILMLPLFDEFFLDHTQEASKLTHALTDWVDVNDSINEFEGVQRGREDSIYTDRDIKVKDGKFLTLSEIRLVAGMNDVLYAYLTPYLTVYSGIDKINACLADDNMIKALIYHYTNHSGCTAPISYEDKKKMDELVELVRGACPDPEGISQTLNSALGLTDLQQEATGTEDAGTETGTGEKVVGCKFQFLDLVTDENNVFRIKASGVVGQTRVTITEVIASTGTDPTKWPVHYFRID